MVLRWWALLDIEQTITPTGYKIVVTTNILCHLKMRWTTKHPWIHKKAILTRGIRTKDDVRFCFVVYEDNEQEEAYDTIKHTFIKEPWPSCETRWFYFYGTIQGEVSPSTSPIFEKHRVAPEWWLIIKEPWTVTITPPDFTRVILEPWTVTYEQPEWAKIITEIWTVSEEQPSWSKIIQEPWTSSQEAPSFSLVINEPWTS